MSRLSETINDFMKIIVNMIIVRVFHDATLHARWNANAIRIKMIDQIKKFKIEIKSI